MEEPFLMPSEYSTRESGQNKERWSVKKVFSKVYISMLIVLTIASLGLRIYSLVEPILVVNAKVLTRGDKLILQEEVIEFTFALIVENFWNAKAYMNLVLIVFGAVIIHISGSICMLFVLSIKLFYGEDQTSSAIRRIVSFFDFLLKFALIDVVFASYVVILLGDRVVVLEEFVLQTNANPVNGIYTAITCTLLSAAVFRLNAASYTIAIPEIADLRLKKSLVATKFKHAYRGITILFLLLFLFALAYYEAICEILITFKLKGIAGSIIGKKHQLKEVHIVDVGADLADEIDELKLGPLYMASVYYTITVAIPLLLSLIATFYFLAPLSSVERMRIASVFSALFRFCGADVLLVSTLAAYLEMHYIADWVFSDRFPKVCHSMDKFLHVPCMSTDQYLGPGFAFLILGNMVLVLAFLFMMDDQAKQI